MIPRCNLDLSIYRCPLLLFSKVIRSFANDSQSHYARLTIESPRDLRQGTGAGIQIYVSDGCVLLYLVLELVIINFDSVCVAFIFKHTFRKSSYFLWLEKRESSTRIEQMVQPQNLFFFITSMVVPRGTAAPVLFQWFVGRDVSTGAPFFDGTIIPIPTSLLPSIVYLHSRGVIRSMDEAKSLVLVGASRPILLPNRIWRSSPETRAKDGRKVIAPLSKTRALPLYGVIVFNLIIIGFMRDFSYPESFRGVLCLLLLCTLILPYNHGCNRLANTLLRRKRQTLRPQRRNYKSSVCPFFPPHFEIGSVRPYPHRAQVSEFGPSPSPRSAQGMKLGPSGGGGVPDKIGLERCLALPTSRLLMAVGHGYYRKAPMMNMHLSHGGVCIFIMGVIWSRDPWLAYVHTK